MQRLSKTLAAAGVASRRACETLIFAGRVKVNGEVVLIPQTQVSEQDAILVDGQPITTAEKKVYFLLNKPAGRVCSTTGSKTVFGLFKGIQERLFTVGRLDKETTGLLIVTNDGHFAQRVIHPSSNVIKEYVAKTDQEITDWHLKEISKGTTVEGVFIQPVSVKKLRRGTIKVSVSEGKKREVRHLIEAVGLEVWQLSRVRIGGLHLGDLPIGTWRPLTEREKELIFE